MMKKVIIIITSVIVSFAILIRIPINLHRNAYYYATHMPHKSNQYPFVPVLVGHYLPSKYVLGYTTKNVGSARGPLIIVIEKKAIRSPRDMIWVTEDGIFYFPNKGVVSKGGIISIAENGDYDGYSYDGYSKDKNVPSDSKKLLLTHLNKIQNEIKQNVPKPKVNLQWIWNIWFKIHYR